jgi:hypothetical protein
MLDQVCKFAVFLLFLGSALMVPVLLYPSAQRSAVESIVMTIGVLVFLGGVGVLCSRSSSHRRG